jgi:hypothetical protein
MMSRISSTKATFFYKRVFPFLWFGGLLLILAFGLLPPSRDSQAPNIPFLIVPVLMGVVGYRFMQKMVFCLADEVLDAEDAGCAQRRTGRTHFAVRHQERQLFALHEPAAGHPFTAAAHRVRRHGCFLRTSQHRADVEQPGDQQIDRPH